MEDNNYGAEVKKDTPKKSKIPFFACLAVLVVAVVGIGAFAVSKWRTSSMSPTEYMQYVEEKERDAGGELIAGYFEQLQKATDLSNSSRKGLLRVELSDGLKQMVKEYSALAAMAGTSLPDLSKLDSVEIEESLGKDGGALGDAMVLKANGTSLLTLNLFMDMEKGKMYLQMPELSKSYLDLSDSMGEAGEGLDSSFQILNTYLSGELFPSASDIEDIYRRYLDIFIRSHKDVEKQTNQTCEAEGVSQKADLYIASYEEKEAVALAKEFVETLKGDEQILSCLEKMGVEKGEYTETLEDALESLEDSGKENGYLTVSDYVADDTVIGREIKGYEDKEAKEETFLIQCLMPRDGEKLGYLIDVESEGKTQLQVKGSGLLKNYVLEGEFSVLLPSLKQGSGFTSEELLRIKLTDYDLVKMKKGESTGTMELSMPGLPALAGGKLVITPEGDVDHASTTVDVALGEQKLGSIVMANQKAEAVSIREPGDGETIYRVSKEKDVEQYFMEMDTEGVLKHIKEVTGINLTPWLGALASGAF